MAIPSLTFERGEYLYFVSPLTPVDPSPAEMDEMAFAEVLRKQAPNDTLLWLQGRYVESEKANLNGHIWPEGELVSKALTPMFQPVTLMHDPRAAVGMIADVKLTPKGGENPTTRLDTTLAIWKHRFPEVAHEVLENFNAGTLAQSMEARVTSYSCDACGQVYAKLPGGAEQKTWCEHLAGSEVPRRRFQSGSFTGTGLIFGSRGARPAYDEASLVVFQEEIAESYEKASRHRRRSTRSRVSNMETIEINRSEYDALKADALRVKDLEAQLEAAKTEAAKTDDLQKDVEKLETAKVAAEAERDDLKTKVEQADEAARATKLAGDRLGTLGKDFLAKLGEKTKDRLKDQAASLDDDTWKDRLEELAELTGVKSDEGGTAETDETFSREETAGSTFGDHKNDEVSSQRRGHTVKGLAKLLSK